MAIILGRKIITDSEEFNDFAVGLSLPIQITNIAFNQNFDTIEQVKTNIINLFKTKQGERIMHPDFGSGLHRILFSQIDDNDFTNLIEETIETAIEKWLPYVTVNDILVDIDDKNKDMNAAFISITFSVNGNVDLNTVTFNIEE